MGQLLNSDLAVKPSIGGKNLGFFDTANFPVPTTAEVRYFKPLVDGDFSAGGKTTYGTITAERVFDPTVDESLLTFLEGVQGDPIAGGGTCSYFKAPGGVIAGSPLAGKNYDVVLLTAQMTDGVDVKGDKLTMLTITMGVQGTGK